MKNLTINSLTEGPVNRSILLFTGPLILGNLFQQLYNTTDSFVVGNFVGSSALAAIGASAQIINLFIGFVIGLTSGAGIIIAQYYGSGDSVRLIRSIHTSFWFCILLGILISVAGFLFSPSILSKMNTPPEVIQAAKLYLRIYFLGALFTIIYNMGAGTLQAVGDTRHPLYFLCISSVVNAVLSILFVAVFHLAVLGVAIATLIAQFVSAFCVVYQLCHTKEGYRLTLSHIRYDKEMLIKLLKFGIPAGIQTTITSLSNVVVQGYLNAFGAQAMAGNTIYSKVDSFALLPANCLSLTTTTYIAQNIGAHKYDRVRKGFTALLRISIAYAGFVGLLLFFFSQIPLRLFTSEAEVIRYGTMMARILAPGYMLLTSCQILIGMARGTGNTFYTMLLFIFNLCGLRILWLTVMIPHFPSIYTLYLGYPLTWGTAVLCMILYYYKKIRPGLLRTIA